MTEDRHQPLPLVGMRPHLSLPAFVMVVGLVSALGCPRSEPAPPPFANIVLVTLDTTRADHLGSYAYPRPTTPFLDELAERGIRFTRAFTPSPLTVPAHASILTSLFPEQHRILDNLGR